MTPDSPAGVAYGSIAKSLRRRRAELVAMIDAGSTAAETARSYEREHPLEPVVTPEEIEVALADRPRARTPARR